ncbi:MAG: HDOD domain-containing protein [Myxococcales bacterium]
MAFDLCDLADYPRESRQPPSDAQLEKASWLAELAAERVRTQNSLLPAFPALAARILAIMQEPDPDLRELAKTIRSDPAVSARLLNLANSAFYSRGVEVKTVQEAAVRLGMKTVSSVAVAAATQCMLDAQERETFDIFREHWKRLSAYCTQSAVSARWLSLWLSQGDPEHAFLAGLMHDIGKVVALRAVSQMVLDGDAPSDLDPRVTDAVLELSHVPLGSDVAMSWNLPGYVMHACQSHHDQALDAGAVNSVLHVVRVASGLYESRTDAGHRAALAEEVFSSAHALGLAQEPLKALAEELKRLSRAS